MKKVIVLLALINVLGELTAQDNWFEAQTAAVTLEWISASSELVEGQYKGKYIYPPINILDGDFSTTWCEADENGSGIGELINIQLKEPVSFDEIQIVNGFASGKDYYHKNNRVKTITLTQTANRHFQRKQYELKDNVEGWQSIKFGLLQTAQTLTIKIDDIYKGYKYDDTCLCDIRFLYKGKAIPVKNVQEIKKIQEETSRNMLKTDMASFKRSFDNLFKGKEYLYLKEPDKATGYRITGKYYTLLKMRYVTPADELFKIYASQYEKGKYDYMAGRLNRYGNNRNYELGNFRLIETTFIDYVETRRTLVIKFSGDKGLYLNGVFYDILDADKLLYLEKGF